ncbi:protein FAM187B isoform X4 [Peromyscus leucopus]|uniref:protein FAM187B isoform X4 n=1 Tax=Peromyscus leucopus TaxID=10041 RepID=UPI00188587AB|nr:protein FAM187B isoform X4 [Peromyscus leucopus]
MLTILWILLSLVLPGLGLHLPVSCPRAKECQLALLSNNDVLLECSISKAHWFFFGLDTGDKPISLSIISNTKQNPDGSLLIKNPSPFNTGLYKCRDKNGNQVTGYKIDFQDIKRLHVTHIDLGQKPLANETLHLGHREACALGSQQHRPDLAGAALGRGPQQLHGPVQRWPAAADLPASRLQMFCAAGTDSPVQPHSLRGSAGG